MGSQRVGHDWATELNWTVVSLLQMRRLKHKGLNNPPVFTDLVSSWAGVQTLGSDPRLPTLPLSCGVSRHQGWHVIEAWRDPKYMLRSNDFFFFTKEFYLQRFPFRILFFFFNYYLFTVICVFTWLWLGLCCYLFTVIFVFTWLWLGLGCYLFTLVFVFTWLWLGLGGRP